MSLKERVTGIWLMAMTLLALFAFTCYFVAQMWLNILRAGYIALAVAQVLALTIYMWGPEPDLGGGGAGVDPGNAGHGHPSLSSHDTTAPSSCPIAACYGLP